MIFSPAILALLLAAGVDALLLAGCALFGLRLLRRWNPASGADGQIGLEKGTWLVSTLVMLVLLVELPSLPLFVHTADRLAPMFTGAMCAVGSLKVNAFGMPALYAKLAVFFLASAWLVLNHLDGLGWDYPLTRRKYALLLVLAPAALVEAGLLWAYFLGLEPAVITSCCGSLFGPAATGAAADLAALPAPPAMMLSAGLLLVTLAAGWRFLRSGRGGRLYGGLALAAFAVALVALVAYIAPYVYESPNHHCPFCLLQAEHGHAGWILYPPLFLAAATGLGAGVSAACAGRASLAEQAPRLARRLAGLSMFAFAAFAAAALGYILGSNLTLLGD
ncbi:MAG: hypothetical protein HGA75_17570 [Thiobacillus sp.]|nr:hypothetical protein [Thiobacillus sp.]